MNAAIQDDVDVIGLSCHSWEYLYYLDELASGLQAAGASIPIVVGGSVVTDTDARALKGVAAAFGATATPSEIIETITRLARAHTDAP